MSATTTPSTGERGDIGAGLTRAISETRPLDHVNEAIADVEAGRVAARVVLQP
ncbi:MAG: hypothetical protein ACJ780_13390 [Solirubrobacteraceae bacterium]